jgi:hypothetical protein
VNWEDLEPGDVLIDQELWDISDFLFIRNFKLDERSRMLWFDLSNGTVFDTQLIFGPITQFMVLKST